MAETCRRGPWVSVNNIMWWWMLGINHLLNKAGCKELMVRVEDTILYHVTSIIETSGQAHAFLGFEWIHFRRFVKKRKFCVFTRTRYLSSILYFCTCFLVSYRILCNAQGSILLIFHILSWLHWTQIRLVISVVVA